MNNNNNNNSSNNTSNDSFESIEYLKQLFCQHFKIELNQSLNELKLDYNSLNLIFQIWIKKLSLNNTISGEEEEQQQHHNEQQPIRHQQEERLSYLQNLKKEYKHNKELKNSLKYLKSLNKQILSGTIINQNEVSATNCTSSLSSIPSVSMNVSDDDCCCSIETNMSSSNSSSNNSSNNSNNNKNMSKLNNSSGENFDNLELNDELIYENIRLKQTIVDLRYQLNHAEDLNCQIGHDCEQMMNRNEILNRVNSELSSKLSTKCEENDQNIKLAER